MKYILKLAAVLSLFLYASLDAIANEDLPIVREEVKKEIVLIDEIVLSKQEVLQKKDASFVKVHFGKFNVPSGVTVRVRNESGTEVYEYSKHEKDQFTVGPNDDGKKSFYSMSITGDTAVVEVIGANSATRAVENKLVIDYYYTGLPEDVIESLYQDYWSDDLAGPESTCGVDDKVPTPCIKDTYPEAYERMRPIAKIFNGGGSTCTAWRVGPDNHMFTNHHCNNSQADIAASESWFYYEYETCNGTERTTPIKVAGDQLLAADYVLDYALFTVKNFQSIEQFGYFGLEPIRPAVGERIYRGGHGSGLPKRVAVESDMNASGFCEIDALDKSIRGPGTDLAYYCDSIGGSSGSPVVYWNTGRVIALHHYGGCTNSGVKMELIWPEVSDFFGGVIPNGDNEPPSDRRSPVAVMDHSCTDLTCTFDGSDSYDPDGDAIVEYYWNFGDGNTGTGGPTIEHTYAATDVYYPTLTVRDTDGSLGGTRIAVAPRAPGENNLPVVNFGISENENYTVKLFDQSVDYDGEIVNIEWFTRIGMSWDTEPFATGPEAQYTYPIGGKFYIRLKVTDNDGGSKLLHSLITVNGPIMNEDPVADFDVQATNEWAKYRIIDNSYDPEGPLVRYYWRLGPHYITDVIGSPGIVQLEEGANSMYLYVYDEWGVPNLYYWGTLTVDPPPPPEPPVADFDYSVSLITVSFTDTSTDELGVASWLWDFGDGTTSTEKNPVHTYPSVKATYDVILTVTDSDDLSDSVTKSVFVNPDPPPEIDLSYTSSRGSKGHYTIVFTWTGAPTDNVVFKYGSSSTTMVNDGTHSISIKKKEKGTRVQVCDTDGYCSNTVALQF